jgi:hypothetical protein
MPTATPFTALGRGNGFPFCPVNLEVSVYDYWTTLGGFNHESGGTPLQAEIDLSLVNAMKLYWNFYGATLSVSAATAEVNNIDVSDDARAEPSLRVCGGFTIVTKSDEAGEAEFGFDVYFAEVQVVVNIFRYTLNGEFIGYGLNDFVIATALDVIGGDSLSLSILGASNSSSDFDFSLVTISGIPFLCAAFSSDANANAATISVSAGDSSASITSFDFYTYP